MRGGRGGRGGQGGINNYFQGNRAPATHEMFYSAAAAPAPSPAPVPAPAPPTNSYEALFAAATADVGLRKPQHPGPGASKAAIEEYHDKMNDYNFNMQSRNLQLETEEQAKASSFVYVRVLFAAFWYMPCPAMLE